MSPNSRVHCSNVASGLALASGKLPMGKCGLGPWGRDLMISGIAMRAASWQLFYRQSVASHSICHSDDERSSEEESAFVIHVSSSRFLLVATLIVGMTKGG